jgi:hypothetical protein
MITPFAQSSGKYTTLLAAMDSAQGYLPAALPLTLFFNMSAPNSYSVRAKLASAW